MVELEQRRDLRIGEQNHIATATAVAAIGPTEGTELFAHDGGTAVAAAAGSNMHHNAINECGHVPSSQSKRVDPSGPP